MFKSRVLRRRIGALAMLLLSGAGTMPSHARSILFVGNSFTFGAGSPVMRYHPDRVTDLNNEGIGGVPALFKTFAEQSGQDWAVSLETSPGKDLAFHLTNKKAQIDRRWDVVTLQGYSTLDAQRPGDPTHHVAAAVELAAMFHRANPQVRVELISTWSRADLTYRPGGHWYGKPIARMEEDIAAGNALALRASPDLTGAIAVGAAWDRAIRQGVADPDPYDGIDYGKVDLWTHDQYHASVAGYYLEALMIFGKITGVDPRTLGENERASSDLGMDSRVVRELQRIAAEELGLVGAVSARTVPARTVPAGSIPTR